MLSMWVVYDSPSDYPGRAIARRFDVDGLGARPTGEMIDAPSLTKLRSLLRVAEPGAATIPRDPSDEPQIVEVWL